MKHFSKQLSWLLAFVLIFSSIIATGIPAYASDDTIYIGEGTDEVIPAGTTVGVEGYRDDVSITYYGSANSDTVLYEQYDYISTTIGSNEIATKPYAWHVKYDKIVKSNASSGTGDTYYFKAYPDTSLETLPVSTQMTLPAGTTVNTTGAAINVSVYVGGNKLTDYNEASSSFTLPGVNDLSARIDSITLNNAGYHIPDLTELFYTVELKGKSESQYSLKLTLVPTVEVTINANTGTLDPAVTKMHATPYAIIDSTKLPAASKNGVNFYGWEIGETNKYVYLKNKTDDNKSSLAPRVSADDELKAMYQEKKPTFTLDLENKKVKNLLHERTYAYPNFSWDTLDYTTITADAKGEFVYEGLPNFDWYCQLRLNSQDPDTILNSEYVSLSHNTPNKPSVERTATSASVTNTSDFTDCEFAIMATNDNSPLSWGASSAFSGLTPETVYKIYAKHPADENGFESYEAESAAFTTSKLVSDDAPNGVTIENIPAQANTSSVIEPVLVIKDGDKTLVKDTDYTVAYSNNTDVGTATATVTFFDNYSGTMTKNFEIAYSHLVSFDGSEGTGTMPNVSVIDGQQYTLPICAFTAPVNKDFKAWDIGGTEYAAGDNLTITANTTVTAVWKDLEKVKTPAISPNGGSFNSSQTVTLTDETADAIIHYTTNGTEPTTGSTVYTEPFTINSSVTVKAIAVKAGMLNSDVASSSFTKRSSSSDESSTSTYNTPTFTVTFNTDGGSTINNKSIQEDSLIGEIPAPVKDGYVFDGWYSDKDLTIPYDANTKITAATTLYAKWTKIEPTENSNNELVLTIGKNNANVFGIDKTIDSTPIIKNNRTVLPARFIAESLGAEVNWNGKKREVTIKGKNKKGEDVTIILYIDSDIAYVNGKEVKLDCPAFIENRRTFTPLRFVAEQLGADVLWIPEDKKVVITK